jgi:DNA replication ATP-dependent helicase Dna2
VQNEVEANLVHQITEIFLGAGVRQEQIGIISLYRQQIKCLSHLLQDRKEIEILTADRSQGRDKDCIVVSMVRSNDTAHVRTRLSSKGAGINVSLMQVGDLVKDWRRMNVSFTRARSKLIIVGSRTTLKAAPLLAEFFDLMDGRGWILPLPPGADQMHTVPFGMVPSPKKRAVDGGDEAHQSTGKENSVVVTGRPHKVAKIKRPLAEGGLLKGRPILKDLLNDNR